MDIRYALLPFLVACTGQVFGLNNQLVIEKNTPKKNPQSIKPASLCAVLSSMRAVNIPKQKLKKTEEKRAEILGQKFLSLAKDFFRPKKDSWTPVMTQTINTTIALTRIFCTQKATTDRNWKPLHETLAKLSIQRKLATLMFAHYLLAPKKFLNILAHNLRNDFTKDGWLYMEYRDRLKICPFFMTNTVWTKIGVYYGTKKPHHTRFFYKTDRLKIPLDNGFIAVNLNDGKQATITQTTKKLLSPTKKKSTKKTFNPFDITRGSYAITAQESKDAEKPGYKITINGTTYHCIKPYSQACLTSRAFGVIEGSEDAKDDAIRAYLVNFEQDGDDQSMIGTVKSPLKSNSEKNTYNQTKIRHTKDLFFFKGKSTVVAVDLNSTMHTKFKSDFTIRDIYISPDKKYIAICEDIANKKYAYHVFKLSHHAIPLHTYLRSTILPPTTFYGSSWTIFDTIRSIFSITNLSIGCI